MSTLGCQEQCGYYEYCVSFCVHLCFHFSGYIRRSGIARSYNTGNTFKQDRIFANERILFHSRGLWPSEYDSFLCVVFFCSRAEDVIPEMIQGTWLDF